MYKNVIFDLYGTLVDIYTDESSDKFWEKAVKLFADYGAKYTPEQLRINYAQYVRKAKRQEKLRHPDYKYIDINLIEVFEKLLKDKDVKTDKAMLGALAVKFRKASTVRLSLYDGVLELLQGLKNSGRGVYLLSNAQECFTVPELEELGIINCFDGIMISSQEKVSKPQKQFFEKLINKFELNPETCVMVGNDKTADMLGAKGVGIDGVYIHQDISPEVEDESEICAVYKIMDGDVHKILPYILEA